MGEGYCWCEDVVDNVMGEGCCWCEDVLDKMIMVCYNGGLGSLRFGGGWGCGNGLGFECGKGWVWRGMEGCQRGRK